MDSIATATPSSVGVADPPRASTLVAVVLAGVAGAALTVLLLALTCDHVSQLGVHAGLQVWGMLGLVLAGVVAWWRRPESRFGTSACHKLGILFDLVPAVVVLHVVRGVEDGDCSLVMSL